MLEEHIAEILRGNAALSELLGNRSGAIDLVDVPMEIKAPYLVFNLGDGQRLGRPNLCSPGAIGLLSQQLLLMPWAPTAPLVKAINDAARTALLSASAAALAAWDIQSIQFVGYRQWAREPDTNLLTRGQLLTVQHNE